MRRSFTDYRRSIRPLRAGIRVEITDATKSKDRATLQPKDIFKAEAARSTKKPFVILYSDFRERELPLPQDY
jgi:hypothetical protein